jgi:zinc/manganese transport system permease protein
MNLGFLEIISPALIIAVLIALTHSLLGQRVLEKGIIFIDLAIAQIAALGLVVAAFVLPDFLWIHQIIAISFALIASMYFYYVEKNYPDILEAVIGCSFIFAAAIIILLLSDHPHGGDEVKNLLSGQIIFVTFSDVLIHLPIYLVMMLIWFLKPKLVSGFGFYVVFSFVITSSVQLAGIYVVFASLILPAILARNFDNKLLSLWSTGVSSVLLGLIVSVFFDLPAGITIVLSYFFMVLTFLSFSFVFRKLKS